MNQPDNSLWIQTFTDIEFYPYNPMTEDIRIADIAESLSKICRFNGHCNGFYSVAQHSVIVSQSVPAKDALWGLLHDASEAYIHDISRPLKSSSIFAPYKMLEEHIMSLIARRFHLPGTMPQSVKEADEIALHNEAFYLMRKPSWVEMDKVHKTGVDCYKPLSHTEAKEQFIARFNELF